MGQITLLEVLRAPQIMLGGIRTDCVSSRELTGMMVADCTEFRSTPDSVVPRIVFDTNGHALSLAALNPEYRAAVELADVVHADGQPLVAFSRFFRSGAIPHRTATTDLIIDCAREASKHGLGFYLLGGTEEVNAAAALALKRLFPDLVISGRRHGFFTRDEEPAICLDINLSKADVVWVGLGKPTEQMFCIRNASAIKAGWIITCGGCFNFLTGSYKRAPKIFQDMGLEWLHRVVSNPNRELAWRYFTTVPHSMLLLLIASRTLPARVLGPLERRDLSEPASENGASDATL